jgi:hypothetical protein
MSFAMYRRKFLCCAVLLILCSLVPVGAGAVSESHGAEVTPNLPFASGEELVYEGEFTRALLRGIDIADLRFTAELEPAAARSPGTSQEAGGARSLRLTVDAVSKGLLRKLFGVRFHQHIESVVDPDSFAVLQTTKLDEQGERRRTSEAVFDRTAGKVVWTERDPNNPAQEPRVVTSDFSGAVQDIASIFYYLRTQPLAPGKRFEISISDSGRVYRIPFSVVDRKKMKTVLGEVQTLRLEPEMFGEGRLIRGEGKISIWLTDDARHIPVQARISSGMGTLNIKLKKVTNGTLTKAQ